MQSGRGRGRNVETEKEGEVDRQTDREQMGVSRTEQTCLSREPGAGGGGWGGLHRERGFRWVSPAQGEFTAVTLNFV